MCIKTPPARIELQNRVSTAKSANNNIASEKYQNETVIRPNVKRILFNISKISHKLYAVSTIHILSRDRGIRDYINTACTYLKCDLSQFT